MIQVPPAVYESMNNFQAKMAEIYQITAPVKEKLASYSQSPRRRYAHLSKQSIMFLRIIRK